MRKVRLLLSILCISYSILLMSCSSISNTHYDTDSRKNESETQIALSKKMQADTDVITQAVNDSLTEVSRGWIATDGSGISVLVSESNVYVTIRTISPDILARIADEITSSAVASITSLGYEKYRIQIVYYTKTQSETDKNSIVSWETTNGETGLFVDASQKYTRQNYSIEDLYNYCNDFYRDKQN